MPLGLCVQVLDEMSYSTETPVISDKLLPGCNWMLKWRSMSENERALYYALIPPFSFRTDGCIVLSNSLLSRLVYMSSDDFFLQCQAKFTREKGYTHSKTRPVLVAIKLYHLTVKTLLPC